LAASPSKPADEDIDAAGQDPRQRIDRWMWCARFFKTRSLAAKFISTGRLRANGVRITKASHTVRPHDVLTFPLAERIRVVEVLSFVERRGSATIAQGLYEDQSPPPPTPEERKHSSANPAPPASPNRRDRARLRSLKSGS